jgi:hypothetical protein
MTSVSRIFGNFVLVMKGAIIYGPPDVIVDATISLDAILVGLRLGPPLGLAWPPLAGSGPGPARIRLGSTVLLSTTLGVIGAILMRQFLMIPRGTSSENENDRRPSPASGLSQVASVI